MHSNVTSLRKPLDAPPAKKAGKHYNIVVAGEFNSGKSSVINLLLRKDVLPTTVGYSQMPPLRIFPSPVEHYNIQSISNDPVDVAEFRQGKIHGTSVHSARIETALESFTGAIITEISIDQNGDLGPEAHAILHSADLLIWCTMGQRAWCLSEITIVESLPEAVRKNAILAVTRADFLRNDRDCEKVHARLKRAASKYFDKITLIDASQKSIRDSFDDNLWGNSGGQVLFNNVMSEFSKSDSFGRPAPMADLKSIDTFRPPPTEISIPEVVTAWQNEIDGIEVWITENDTATESSVARFILHRIRLFAQSIFATDKHPPLALAPFFDMFQKTGDRIEKLADVGGAPGTAILAVELIMQLEEELVCLEY